MMASTQRKIDRVIPKIGTVDYVSRVIARDRKMQWTKSSDLKRVLTLKGRNAIFLGNVVANVR
jgi:hypothetical protein